MIYPNDDNGDALRRMEEEGDDLARPRNIDFTIVFPDGDAAKRFAEYFQEQGYTASVDFAETVQELPWDVVIAKYMTPSHQEITDFEISLQEVAESMGGRNDGWGCFSESKGNVQ